MTRGGRCFAATALFGLVLGGCARVPHAATRAVTVREARALAAGSAVRVRGILGLYESATRAGYLQDAGAGLFVEAGPGAAVPPTGGQVEAEGVLLSRAGAPYLRAAAFRILPSAAATPAAEKVAPGPAPEGTWLLADGVVTDVVELSDGRAHALRVAQGDTTFVACVAEPRDRPVGRANILGFRVRARGLRVSPADSAATAAGCTLRLPTRVFLRLLEDAPLPAELPPPPLGPIAGIRALTPDEARERRPVRVRGVVTAHDPEENLLFVQDQTAGIYVEAWRHLYDVQPGQLVEVTGWTERGAFAPIIVWPRLAVLGTAPAPTPLRLDAAVVPRYDSQWTEAEGIVRAARRRGSRAVLDLLAFGERLQVDVLGVADDARMGALVGAQVRVRGVYKTEFSPTRQVLGVGLSVPRPELVSVVDPAPADPYGEPLRRAASVLDFHPRDPVGRRIHVRGTVTLHRPGRFLYLRDESGPLRVESRDAAALAPGTLVDVVGFPQLGEYRPRLEDASVRTLAPAPPPAAPAPRAVRPEEALRGELDGELVTLEGRLVELLRTEGERRLVLQSPLCVFEAVLPSAAGGEALDTLRAQSRLAVTGIAVVHGDAARVPQSVQVLLRDAADVRVVAGAPWWTPRRAGLAAAALFALAAGAFAWVAALRHRVREQTEVLRGRLSREAALEERTRLARELHDSLEQNLAGIGYALEAARQTLGQPQVARGHLDRALLHVDGSMGEARRSVWALRPLALEAGDLASALGTLAREVTRGGVAQAELQVHGDPWPLAPAVEDQLFRVAQEALTNALKHAGARFVRLNLRFGADALAIVVEDDGRGFDARVPAGPGHFGLVGMRERTAAIGATLELRSEPGRGTAVSVLLPRGPAALSHAG